MCRGDTQRPMRRPSTQRSKRSSCGREIYSDNSTMKCAAPETAITRRRPWRQRLQWHLVIVEKAASVRFDLPPKGRNHSASPRSANSSGTRHRCAALALFAGYLTIHLPISPRCGPTARSPVMTMKQPKRSVPPPTPGTIFSELRRTHDPIVPQEKSWGPGASRRVEALEAHIATPEEAVAKPQALADGAIRPKRRPKRTEELVGVTTYVRFGS